jgi:hypothetical protein
VDGAVIEDVLVDLVGDGQSIELVAERRDPVQLRPGEDLARGIVR